MLHVLSICRMRLNTADAWSRKQPQLHARHYDMAGTAAPAGDGARGDESLAWPKRRAERGELVARGGVRLFACVAVRAARTGAARGGPFEGVRGPVVAARSA
jgi:hypothetical protein